MNYLLMIIVYVFGLLAVFAILKLSIHYKNKYLFRKMETAPGFLLQNDLHNADLDKDLKMYFQKQVEKPIRRRNFGSP